jgi:hypothetical protein
VDFAGSIVSAEGKGLKVERYYAKMVHAAITQVQHKTVTTIFVVLNLGLER